MKGDRETWYKILTLDTQLQDEPVIIHLL